ncbi:membrane-spanning 4-domains subfamily A member 15-like [Pholidichthys leucotaenia]
MSVSMSKAEGVTILTLNTDPQRFCPPLCQILKNLCYSPLCCSVSEHLRKVQGSSQTVLGTLQIMVGLLNIGFGVIFQTTHLAYSWWFWRLMTGGFPYWLGGLFIVFGIMCILSEKYPSACLIILSAILNLAGVAFAITAIVLYSRLLAAINPYNSGFDCDRRDYYGYWRATRTAPSFQDELIQQKCQEAQFFYLILLRSIGILVIVMSVLQLCVAVSSIVLGIKALRNKGNGQEKTTEEPEHCKPQLEEETTKSAV